jgi:predicted RNA binding protein YcfA (HicA-like mRNA interferase family)
MPELPVISCIEAVKALERAGWKVKRAGNHFVMTKFGSLASLSIPNHHEIAKGTLRKLIRLAGLNIEEFIQLLS